MTDTLIRAPRFEFGAAVTQLFNLPGGKGYLFRVMGFGTLLLMLALVALGFPIIKTLSLYSTMGDVDVTTMEFVAPIFASMGYVALLYIFQIGIYISIESALYRNIIHGEDKGFFPLRFGGGEFKVLITRIVVAIILCSVFFAVYFGGVIIGVALEALGAAIGSAVVKGVIGILIAFFVLVAIGALIYASVRLAPSAAFAVRDVDFTPVGSWGPMGSYCWPTFGAVLVVGLVGYFGLMIFSLLAFGILLYASGIIDVIAEIDLKSDVVPYFPPLIEALTSVGFIVTALSIMAIVTFFSFLYMGAIWSIWGYVAKLTARPLAMGS